VVATLYKTGKFTQNDVYHVWIALIGCSVGLLASTLGRLYASTFYALEDTRSPLRIAMIRVALSTSLGYAAGIKLPFYLGLDASWGVVCLTIASSLGAWAEFLLLRRNLNKRIGRAALPWSFLWRIGVASVAASMAGLGVKTLLDTWGASNPALRDSHSYIWMLWCCLFWHSRTSACCGSNSGHEANHAATMIVSFILRIESPKLHAAT
jgi:putative peptidoglycan lipid II flippase